MGQGRRRPGREAGQTCRRAAGGGASREELLRWLKQELIRRQVGSSQLMSLMDNDRSGTATFSEFSGGLTAANFTLKHDEYMRLFKALAFNGDRSLSIDEMRRHLYGRGGGEEKAALMTKTFVALISEGQKRDTKKTKTTKKKKNNKAPNDGVTIEYMDGEEYGTPVSHRKRRNSATKIQRMWKGNHVANLQSSAQDVKRGLKTEELVDEKIAKNHAAAVRLATERLRARKTATMLEAQVRKRDAALAELANEKEEHDKEVHSLVAAHAEEMKEAARTTASTAKSMTARTTASEPVHSTPNGSTTAEQLIAQIHDLAEALAESKAEAAKHLASRQISEKAGSEVAASLQRRVAELEGVKRADKALDASGRVALKRTKDRLAATTATISTIEVERDAVKAEAQAAQAAADRDIQAVEFDRDGWKRRVHEMEAKEEQRHGELADIQASLSSKEKELAATRRMNARVTTSRSESAKSHDELAALWGEQRSELEARIADLEGSLEARTLSTKHYSALLDAEKTLLRDARNAMEERLANDDGARDGLRRVKRMMVKRAIAAGSSRRSRTVYLAWKNVSHRQRKKRVLLHRAVAKMNKRLAVASFGSWVEYHGARLRARWLTSKVFRRMVTGALATAWESWEGMVRCEKEKDGAKQDGMNRAQRYQHVVGRCLVRLNSRSLHRSYAAWADHASTRRSRRVLGQRIVLKLHKRLAAASMASWVEMCQERAHARRLCGKVFGRAVTAAVYAAWRSWNAFVRGERETSERAERNQSVARRCLARLQSRRLHTAYAAWAEYGMARRRRHRLRRRAAVKIRQRLAAASLASWAEFCNERNRARHLCGKISGRVVAVAEHAAWTSWRSFVRHERGVTDRTQRNKSVVRRYLARMKGRRLHRSYASWVEHAKTRRRQRVLCGRAATKMRLRLAAASFASWAAFYRGRVRARYLSGKVIGAIASRQMRVVFRSWVEVTRAEAAQRMRERMQTKHQELMDVTTRLREQTDETQAVHEEVTALREWLQNAHDELSKAETDHQVELAALSRELANSRQMASDGEEQRNESVAHRCLVRLQNRRLYATYATWADHAKTRRRWRTICGRVATKVRQRLAAASFASWAAFYRGRARARYLTGKVVGAIALRQINVAFRSWIEATEAEIARGAEETHKIELACLSEQLAEARRAAAAEEARARNTIPGLQKSLREAEQTMESTIVDHGVQRTEWHDQIDTAKTELAEAHLSISRHKAELIHKHNALRESLELVRVLQRDNRRASSGRSGGSGGEFGGGGEAERTARLLESSWSGLYPKEVQDRAGKSSAWSGHSAWMDGRRKNAAAARSGDAGDHAFYRDDADPNVHASSSALENETESEYQASTVLGTSTGFSDFSDSDTITADVRQPTAATEFAMAVVTGTSGVDKDVMKNMSQAKTKTTKRANKKAINAIIDRESASYPDELRSLFHGSASTDGKKGIDQRGGALMPEEQLEQKAREVQRLKDVEAARMAYDNAQATTRRELEAARVEARETARGAENQGRAGGADGEPSPPLLLPPPHQLPPLSSLPPSPQVVHVQETDMGVRVIEFNESDDLEKMGLEEDEKEEEKGKEEGGGGGEGGHDLEQEGDDLEQALRAVKDSQEAAVAVEKNALEEAETSTREEEAEKESVWVTVDGESGGEGEQQRERGEQGEGTLTTCAAGGGASDDDGRSSRVRSASSFAAFYDDVAGERYLTKEDGASAAIQALFRGNACRRARRRALAEEEKRAATSIQNRFRGGDIDDDGDDGECHSPALRDAFVRFAEIDHSGDPMTSPATSITFPKLSALLEELQLPAATRDQARDAFDEAEMEHGNFSGRLEYDSFLLVMRNLAPEVFAHGMWYCE